MRKLWLTFIVTLFALGSWMIYVASARPAPRPTRVAIPALGKTMSSLVPTDFSKARYFLIFDLGGTEVRTIKNPGTGAVGMQAAHALLEEEVGVVLAKQIGRAPANGLQMRGVRVLMSNATTAQQALDQFTRGELATLPQASRPLQPMAPSAAQLQIPELGLLVTASPIGGVMVAQAIPGSRAAASGLMPGDRLLALNGTQVQDLSGLMHLLRAGYAQQPLIATVVRQDRVLNLRL